MQRLSVSITTHLFPSDRTVLSGPWLAEQVDALAPHADVSVLAALRHCRHEDVTRPSGVKVKYRPTVVLPGQGRLALLAAAMRYAHIADRELSALRPSPEVIHAHFGFPDAVVAAPVAQRLGVPLVVTLHGDDAFSLMHRTDWLGQQIRRALAYASAVICVSPAMFAAVRPALPDTVRVLTIENGYDDQLFTLNHEPRHGGLLFVGTLTAVKNVDVLLSAYARLDSPPRLAVVGEGGLRPELEALAAQLGIERNVDFVGVQERDAVAKLMQQARALVVPSSSEGFGLVAAEALACGTPVVASNVGGLPGIVAQDDAGLLVTPGSVDELAHAIERVLARPHDPARVAAASSAVGWSVRAQELLTVYRTIVDEWSRS